MKSVLALLGATALAAAAAAQPIAYDRLGPFESTIEDQRWTDAGRKREVPLRIRVPDAPGARPLVIFSHGLGGSIDGGRKWGEQWASHGFVVIHVQHPGSDESVWKSSENPVKSIRAAASLEQFMARVRDVRFVLDELERRQRAGDAIARKVDLSRIGMSGHSFGAVTTQALAGQGFDARALRAAGERGFSDPRLKAFVAFSPSVRNEWLVDQFGAIGRPFFSITGTEDGLVGAGIGVPAELRLKVFEGMAPGHKFLLNLTGADHMIFNGGGRWRAPRGHDRASIDPARDEHHERLVRGTSTAFWLGTLADDGAALAWLQLGAAYVGSAGEFKLK